MHAIDLYDDGDHLRGQVFISFSVHSSAPATVPPATMSPYAPAEAYGASGDPALEKEEVCMTSCCVVVPSQPLLSITNGVPIAL